MLDGVRLFTSFGTFHTLSDPEDRSVKQSLAILLFLGIPVLLERLIQIFYHVSVEGKRTTTDWGVVGVQNSIKASRRPQVRDPNKR